jgi:hypothetical protein
MVISGVKYIGKHYCPVKEQRPLTSASSVQVAERIKKKDLFLTH